MLTFGTKEALCVAIFAALVWSAHALLRVLVPHRLDRLRLTRPSLAVAFTAIAALAVGAALGYFIVYPATVRYAAASLRNALLWTAVAGPALALLAVPLAFHTVRPSLAAVDQPARRFVWMTPLTMLAAALATPATDVFSMTVVFLPMCVGCMAGVGAAELAVAVAKQTPLPMSRVLIWGFRFGAESLLGAGVCILILTRWR